MDPDDPCAKCNINSYKMHDMQLSGIDLNLLPVLHALLETRSVKLAATRVNLSSSATSHALARLRETLGDPLLVRAGRSLTLTPRAERLRPRLRQLVEGLDAALRFEDAIDPSTLRRAFRIAANDYVELVVAPALSAEVAATAPGVDLFHEHLDDTATALRSGGADLAIGVLRSLPDDVATERLLTERFVCLMREGHPASRGRLTPARFAALDHLLVAPRGQPSGIVDTRLAELGLRRRVARTLSSFVVAPFVLVDSDLVLTVAERVAQAHAAQLGLVMRRPPIELPTFGVVAAWHRRHAEDPAHVWLRERLRTAVRRR